jgi:hypothetical protein
LRSDSEQGTGGDIAIDAWKLVKVTGSENIDGFDYSIYTDSVANGSITIKHGGATNTPFTVGDASANGTKEAIATSTSGILPITDIYILPGSFELGNIKLIDASDINGVSGTDILLGGNTTVPTAEELSQLEQRFRKLVQFGRDKGYPVAARNLEKFLDGSGETEIINKSWLRQFPSISGRSITGAPSAELRLQDYFKRDINTFSTNTPINNTNQTMVVPLGTTYWDADIVAVSPAFEAELFYASGKSSIKATGQFRMEIPPQGSNAPRKIIGNIHYHWYDNYAFIQGEDVLVPFAGWWGIFPERFTDEEAIKLKTYGRARSFDMVADWDQFVYAESSIFGGWNVVFGTI